MICQASAYRAGEYVHQRCVYNDQGAQLIKTNWPEHSLTYAYTYPTNPMYCADTADLVEVRVKPLADATAFDWNPKRRQCSSDCSFQKLDQGFNRQTKAGESTSSPPSWATPPPAR